jgi:hypothetical protein
MAAVQIPCANCLAPEGLVFNIDVTIDTNSVSTCWDFTLHHDHAFDEVLCLVLPAFQIFDDVTASKNEVHIEKNLFAARIALVTAVLCATMITAWLEPLAWLEAIHI